jgi:hypothetical protein
MKASITFFPNEAKKNQKIGKTPVYMRICFKRTKAETRLNAEIPQSELLKWDPITMRLVERNSPINHHLNRLDQKFHEFITLNATQLPKYNASSMKDYVLGNDRAQQRNVLKFVEEYFVNSVLNNVNRMPGTVKNYRRSINHLRNFLKFQRRENLAFDELDYEFAIAFKTTWSIPILC